MHARKLPRISEPSFDRDYGNGSQSGSKMSKNYRDRRSSMSPSDRNMSPRDRSDNRSKYGRRDRERDRERERDYYKNRSSRDRYRDRSPKERKWEHRVDRRERERINEQHRERERERERIMEREHHGHQGSSSNSAASVRSVGDWSEHTSSSGKKYYYNCVTEVSRTYQNNSLKVSLKKKCEIEKSYFLTKTIFTRFFNV